MIYIHPTRNGCLIIAELTTGSDRILWWICVECEKAYDINIRRRCKTTGRCASCARHYRPQAKERSLKAGAKFKGESLAKHGPGLYNYDDSEYISSSEKLTIRCLRCEKSFPQNPDHHLRGEGCPRCNARGGAGLSCVALLVERILAELGITFECEWKTAWLPYMSKTVCPKRYDYHFKHPTKDLCYIIEADGSQHISERNIHVRPGKSLPHRQSIDRLKTRVALKLGKCMIRISRKNYESTKWGLQHILDHGKSGELYRDDEVFYRYLIPTAEQSALDSKIWPEHCSHYKELME